MFYQLFCSFTSSPKVVIKGLGMHKSAYKFMALALQLAKKGRYTTSPNPMVGCVIVKNNQIIGRGYHQSAGGFHAEIYALKEAGFNAKDATAYVTLEPCCHQGKTSPCTQALILAGIKKVVIACLDPNPLVSGKGINELKSAGIEVEIGLFELEARNLNEIFFHYIQYKRPFVITKWAMSLDGKTIVSPNDSRRISCIEAQYDSHDLRQQVDAILIGSNTAKQDNPLLTARLNRSSKTNLKQPLRIILSRYGRLPLNLKIFNKELPGKTIVITTSMVDKKWFKLANSKNIEILILSKNNFGYVDLTNLLEELGKREITSILIEGGKHVLEKFFKENLVNKIHVYLAPTIISSLEKKQVVKNLSINKLGCDFHLTANYQGEKNV